MTPDEQPLRERGPFDGVAQIVRYNWPKFAASLAVIVVSGTALLALEPPPLLFWALLAGALLAGYLTLASLIASHWVYDRSGIYRFSWLPRCVPGGVERWATVHSGLDETTRGLETALGVAPVSVVDIYDESLMSEPSIARARRTARQHERNTPATHSSLPLEDASCEAIFLIFAAHELRASDARRELFREVERSLAPGGRVVIVEHLRDVWNFLVFGPGAFHFWPRRVWTQDLATSTLSLRDEFRLTPFVRVFVAERRPPEPPVRS